MLLVSLFFTIFTGMMNILQSQGFMRNPTSVLADMRANGPLVRSSVPVLGKIWLTTTQAAASHVLKSSNLFSVRKKSGQVVGLQWWMPRSIKRLTNNMLATDEPDHTRLRRLVDDAFHRREIRSMEAQIKTLSDHLLRDGTGKSGEIELVETFARPFPLTVICELLGLPAEDREKFSRWASGLTQVTGMFSLLMAFRRLKPMTRYIEHRVDVGRRELAENGTSTGLIGELISSNEDGNSLTEEELVAMIFLLLFAGHETTTHLISGGVHALLRHPDQLEKLKSDWSLLPMAVEEILRYVSPVQVTKPRYVRQDCEVEGVRLSQGDIIMPMLVAANHDPTVFADPHLFDIERRPNHHMAFGTGIHFCLGHQLARLELASALQTLFGEGKTLELACRENDLTWRKRFGLRALERLPLKTGVR